MPRLGKDFFTQSTVDVAKSLLGKLVVRRYNGLKLMGRVIETEAYFGFNDRASHAFKGRTARTEVMFGPPGRVYVYFVYGLHYCLNVVTGAKDYPAAVLIRALEIFNGDRKKKAYFTASGPAKVCRYLKIDRAFNHENLLLSRRFWLEDLGDSDFHIVRSARVGVGYAGPYWARRRLRFFIRGNPCISGNVDKPLAVSAHRF